LSASSWTNPSSFVSTLNDCGVTALRGRPTIPLPIQIKLLDLRFLKSLPLPLKGMRSLLIYFCIYSFLLMLLLSSPLQGVMNLLLLAVLTFLLFCLIVFLVQSSMSHQNKQQILVYNIILNLRKKENTSIII